MKTLTILGLLLFTLATKAQQCDCKKDLEFLSKAYIEDYAGIQDFANLHPDYLRKLTKFSKRAKSNSNLKECDKLIGEMIAYINNGHVVYGMTEENPLYRTGIKQPNFNPTIQQLNDSTLLLEIKTCDLSYKQQLDSLLFISEKKLNETKHLIIDVRGNEGGGDATFENLIPYLYTNPILTHSVNLWTSENNVKMFEDLLNIPDLPIADKLNIERIVKAAKANPNSFVPLFQNDIDTLTLSGSTAFPKKVSIIIDEHCKSSTEQFLLLAKQSKKTTIYGKSNSGGALDYSNLNFVLTPSGFWYASVPTTRSARLPEYPVDPYGIKPDVFIDKKTKDVVAWVMKK